MELYFVNILSVRFVVNLEWNVEDDVLKWLSSLQQEAS